MEVALHLRDTAGIVISSRNLHIFLLFSVPFSSLAFAV